MRKPFPDLFEHPLLGANIKTLVNASRLYGSASGRCLPHVALFYLSAIARLPFSLADQVKLKKCQSNIIDVKNPVIIVGYWRSGTTHLHNLLGSSSRFGIITPLASGIPGEILTLGTWFESILEKALPETREIDRVKVTAKSPQEDEIPMANRQLLSVFHALYFPANFSKLFEKSVFIENAGKTEIEQWQKSLVQFWKKISLHQKGKRLLIKNPVYTGRIKEILELFPDVKIVHIYRNPYRVYPSSVRYFENMLNKLALQYYDPDEIEPVVQNSYPRMLNRLYKDVERLPSNRFAEVKFEELDNNPLPVLKTVYHKLNLSGWTDDKKAISNYLDSISEYKKNRYETDKNLAKKVEKHWGEFIRRWGYEPEYSQMKK